MQTLPLTLYTAAQVRALDHIAIHEYGIAGITLMTRAGEAVFGHLRERWPNAHRLTVFCGGGNNAGDGYIVATLALKAGLSVTVISLIAPEKLTGDALTAYHDYINAAGIVEAFLPEHILATDVIVDALLGTGLSKPITGSMAEAIAYINARDVPVIAVDIPSGLNPDTGVISEETVIADSTVTFIGLKQGLFTGRAADYCGDIVFNDLAVPSTVFAQVLSTTYRVKAARLPPRLQYSHKGHYGHVLIIGGDIGYSGAIRLAGEAALRTGAGLVSIATRPEHAGFINMGRPELMCYGVENSSQLANLLIRANVIVVGPGLGRSIWAKELFIALINALYTLNTGKKMVIDADGLYFLAQARIKNPGWILTPHPGEAAQLLHVNTSDVEIDRFGAVAAIQARYDGIAVLKGSGTLIASENDIAVSNRGNPGMASGGMGDVLAGVIAGLLAQKLPPKEAAQQGVYLQGIAGDRAVKSYGERGLLASDMLPYLGQHYG